MEPSRGRNHGQQGDVSGEEATEGQVSRPNGDQFDVFLSYSRKDEEFARRLEEALKNYRLPKDVKTSRPPRTASPCSATSTTWCRSPATMEDDRELSRAVSLPHRRLLAQRAQQRVCQLRDH